MVNQHKLIAFSKVADSEDESFMPLGNLFDDLEAIEATEIADTANYKAVSDLNLVYQSRKVPSSTVFLSDGIFHDLWAAHVANVEAFSGLMSASAKDKGSNMLTAAITLVVGRFPYKKGDPKSKERVALTFPYFLSDGKKPTEMRSVGYATEKRNGRDAIYSAAQMEADYNSRLKKGWEILKLGIPTQRTTATNLNHTEQEIYQTLIHNAQFYRELVTFLDTKRIPPNAKIYAISFEMISDFRMCANCQQTSIGGLDLSVKDNVMDRFVKILSGQIRLSKMEDAGQKVRVLNYQFKPTGPHSVVRMMWIWPKSGDRRNSLEAPEKTVVTPRNLKKYGATQILSLQRKQFEYANPSQFAIVTSTHAESLTGKSPEGRKKFSDSRVVQRQSSGVFQSPLVKKP